MVVPSEIVLFALSFGVTEDESVLSAGVGIDVRSVVNTFVGSGVCLGVGMSVSFSVGMFVGSGV